MTTIAVIGASGSLGGLIVRLIASEPDLHVIALSRRPTPVPAKVEVRIADYDDPDALRRSVIDRPISPAEFTAALAHTEDTWWTHAYSSMFASIRKQRRNQVTSACTASPADHRGPSPRSSTAQDTVCIQAGDE